MGRIVGIDLGTCRSVVATMDGPRPRVLQNREAKNQTPSAVSLRKRKGKTGDGGAEVLCGDAAIDNMVMAPRDTVISVKRLMGRAFSDTEVQKVRDTFVYEVKEPSDGTKDGVAIVLGGREYSPIDISAMVLRKLKEDAEFRLGDEVTHAVVTVPAYFSQIQRDATRKAGMKAGLRISRILDEPTAAAIAFGLESEDSQEAKTLLVYDLGGGTFDISVLMWSGSVFVPLNLQGDMWLGGDNFDQLIVDHVVQRVKQDYAIDPKTNVRFMANLKLKAREVKERLTSSEAADLIMSAALQDASGDYIDIDMEITRAEFERMARPLVDRSVDLVKTALKNAELTEADVHYVVMAGSSTCIPMVQKAMEDMFGRERILRKVHPKECVALGAAILATRLGGIVCEAADPTDPQRQCGTVNPLDAVTCSKCGAALPVAAGSTGAGPVIEPGCIAPFSYGTQSLGDKFNVFIKKNDPYPTQDAPALIFYTQRPDQRIISIPVYGGDNLIKASANEKQGEAFAVLPADMPEGTAVRIRLWLDGDGVFALSAHLENGMDLKPTILQGGVIQKIVQRLEELSEMLADVKGKDPAKADRIERGIDEVLDKIKGISDDACASDLGLGSDDWYQKLRREIESGGGPGKSAEVQEAENVVGYAHFVKQRYGWAVNATDQLRLDKAIAETVKVMSTPDVSAIRQRTQELIGVINGLPAVIGAFTWILTQVETQVRPTNPAKANELQKRLHEVEDAFRRNDLSAPAKLEVLIREVQALSGLPTTATTKCRHCSADMPQGKRTCPQCGADQWILRS